MNTPETARAPSTDLELTDELPALDVAAYEREVLSRNSPAPQEPPGPSNSDATGSESPASGACGDPEDDPVPPVVDPDYMLQVEQWIVQKAEQLRAHQAALTLAQREHTAGVARADALSRELSDTSASLAMLNERARILEEELARARTGAQRHTAESDEARREVTRLAHELTVARAAEAQQSAALAASATLAAQHSEALEALRRAHESLSADQQRAAAEREVLQAQLARCLEQLRNREAYRTLNDSTIRELDAELASATVRADEQQARADGLTAELDARGRRLEDAIRERDQARHSHDTVTAQLATERARSERARSAQELRFAELATECTQWRARLLASESLLADAERRAESEALAGATAAERLRATEGGIAARDGELANVQRESERDRASLSDLTAAMVRNQQLLADQSRLLEERESAARSMVASVAEQAAVITALRLQIEGLTERLAAPEAERRALEERLVALTSQVGESDCRVTRLESMNVELRATVRRLHASLSEREAELQRATRIASVNSYALGRVQSSIDELGRGLTDAAGVPAQAQASVLTRIDGGLNHSIVLRGRTTIGRDPDNELPLALSSVSRRHALLIPAFQSALLQDLGSTNGVLVNQRRVRCVRLEHGDVITLGKVQLRYTLAPAPAGASTKTPPRRHTQQ